MLLAGVLIGEVNMAGGMLVHETSVLLVIAVIAMAWVGWLRFDRTNDRATIEVNTSEIEQAADGLHALQLIDVNPPDLVVLDLMLQSLDGRSVQQELAAGALTRDVRWIWITGNHDPEPPAHLGGRVAESVTLGPLCFRHKASIGASGRPTWSRKAPRPAAPSVDSPPTRFT